jgi:hypothetical protein
MTPADVLFSKTKQRLIRTLFGDVHHDGLTFSDILRRTSGGSGAIHRELKRFFAAGLLVQKDGTWQRAFLPNHEHPLYPELRELARKLADAGNAAEPSRAPGD